MPHEIPSEDEVRSWYKTLSNWGRWGPDDELGALNLITPAKRLQAAALVREGIVVSCARPVVWEPTADAPLAPRHFMLKSGDAQPTEPMGRTSTLDAFLIQPHGLTITHLDAPSHTLVRIDPDGPWTIFNGQPRELISTMDGAKVGSIELAKGGIVSRGVLLDVPRVRGGLVEPDDAVFPGDLDAAEQAEGVRVEAGDILFVRTGFPAWRDRVGPVSGNEPRTALQAACLPWLRERDVPVLSSDTSNDVSPTQYPGLGSAGAIHGVGMGAIGLWILDNPTFEDLAIECARLGRWEFQAVIAPLNLERATGSPVNPLAML